MNLDLFRLQVFVTVVDRNGFGHSRREAQAVLDRELDLAYVIRWQLPVEADFEVLARHRYECHTS